MLKREHLFTFSTCKIAHHLAKIKCMKRLFVNISVTLYNSKRFTSDHQRVIKG